MAPDEAFKLILDKKLIALLLSHLPIIVNHHPTLVYYLQC